MKNNHRKSTKPGSLHETAEWTIARREFLTASGLTVAGIFAGTPFALAGKPEREAMLRFGIVTDAHYADLDAAGIRCYRESVPKMAECIALMNDQKVDFLAELGDFKDQGKPASEEGTLHYLDTIEAVFGQYKGPRYHVLGNHDLDSISKEQFLARVENTGIAKGSSYYSFDVKGFHLVVLDANYTADGLDYDRGNFEWKDTNVARKELDWLKEDLAATSSPVIVFIHQPLDGEADHCVRNAAEVRQILQESKKVLAVFQGHNHQGGYRTIEKIHYYTLKAMVDGPGADNNSYAIVEVYSGGTLAVAGYRRGVPMTMDNG